MNNPYGAKSVLKVETEYAGGITKLKDSFFTSPFKIAKPFYEHGKPDMKVCLINVSAGILAGDSYEMSLNMGDYTRTQWTTQSFTRIHKMKEGFAEQNINISLGQGAVLYFLPRPVIPFAGSSFYSRTRVDMGKDSVLYYSDILSCGRFRSGEIFGFDIFSSRIEIYSGEKLIFLDNIKLMPASQDIRGIGFYEGFTHQATLLIFGSGDRQSSAAQSHSFLSECTDIEFGVSQTDSKGIIIRILGRSAEKLMDIITGLCNEAGAFKPFSTPKG